MREISGAAGLGKAAYGFREGSAGAPPRAPFRELFEKSSLKTLKNFSTAGGGALGAGRLQRAAARGGTGVLGGVFGCRAGIVRGGFYIKIGGKAS